MLVVLFGDLLDYDGLALVAAVEGELGHQVHGLEQARQVVLPRAVLKACTERAGVLCVYIKAEALVPAPDSGGCVGASRV